MDKMDNSGNSHHVQEKCTTTNFKALEVISLF